MGENDGLMQAILELIPDFHRHFVRPFFLSARQTVTDSQFNVLLFLKRYPSASMTELAHGLDIAKPQLTSTVDGLAALGYVARENSTRDRRKIHISLTPGGAAFLKKSEQAAFEALSQRLDRLIPAEKESFLDCIRTIRAYADRIS